MQKQMAYNLGHCFVAVSVTLVCLKVMQNCHHPITCKSERTKYYLIIFLLHLFILVFVHILSHYKPEYKNFICCLNVYILPSFFKETLQKVMLPRKLCFTFSMKHMVSWHSGLLLLLDLSSRLYLGEPPRE